MKRTLVLTASTAACSEQVVVDFPQEAQQGSRSTDCVACLIKAIFKSPCHIESPPVVSAWINSKAIVGVFTDGAHCMRL
jgi:hypothetical protein